jgi:hypothetical protein
MYSQLAARSIERGATLSTCIHGTQRDTTYTHLHRSWYEPRYKLRNSHTWYQVAVTLTDHPPRAVTICNTMRATCASGTGHGTVYTPIARSRYHLRCHARNTCRWYRHRCPVSHTLWKLYRSPHCSSSCRQSTCTWYCDGTMYSTWSSWYQCGYHPSAHLTSCPQSACFRLRVTCVRALFH